MNASTDVIDHFRRRRNRQVCQLIRPAWEADKNLF